MATTVRTLSPGGALLRGSRMFSLPAAIPPPTDNQSAGPYQSPTATRTFPTLQTVTAPDNFRQRGDWGFKRNFPLRSTARTSTPLLRIKQVDSIEHVTDYSSAADHSLTLEKFQELNVMMTLPHEHSASAWQKEHQMESVFEDKYDFTALDAEKIREAGSRRWKYKGPWLANLSEGQFLSYLNSHVSGRRLEFREVLKVHLAADLTGKARQHAMDQGLDQEVPDVKPEEVTDEQIMDFLRVSRNARHKLFTIVAEFLDLPPCKPANQPTDYVTGFPPNEKIEVTADGPYTSIGPPRTHPSAGLSYLRTNAFLDNHFIYGPQWAKRPVKARVMITQQKQGSGLVGVGGFVAQLGGYKPAFQASGSTQHDHAQEGGAKAWVNVTSAHVNATGHAILNLVDPKGEAIMVEEEMRGERQFFRDKKEDEVHKHLEIREPKSARALKEPGAWRTGGRREYGLSDAFSGVSRTSAEGPDY